MWIAVILFFVIFVLFSYYDTKKPNKFPPGPSWLPILGSCLSVQKLRRKTGSLQEATSVLANEYGSIMGLKVGRELVVIVSSFEPIKKFLSEEDLCGRPRGFFFQKRTWGDRKGLLLTDKNFWREQRTFVLRNLREFGFGKGNMSALIEEEVNDMISILNKKIEENNGSYILSMGDFFGIHVINTLWTMMAGTRYSPNDAKLKNLQKNLNILLTNIDMTGAMFSYFPFLRFIAPESSGYNLYKNTHERLWEFLDEEIEKHKKTFNPDDPRDLIDVYLKMLKSPDKKDSFSERQLMAICLDLFIAGSETTSKSLGFGFLYLILNPHVQKKCQEEIDLIIGKNKLPTLDDRQRLVYVEGTVMESLRNFSGRAFTVPHRALKDTYLDGYIIPKDTIITANLRRCLLGEECGFSDPEAFRPERYIKNGHIEYPESFIPFGFGRRRCLGETLARANIFIIIAGLLQHFNFNIPPGCPPPTISNTDGVTPGPLPFSVMVTRR